ncbi:MAG: hypothetical protein CM15mP103_02170 [Gammaproteobacteria bacterium]|nr:MAG: hypothetical protein CM15mP103_02170 [Gammaproteobacteria bacterium]
MNPTQFYMLWLWRRGNAIGFVRATRADFREAVGKGWRKPLA